MNAGETPNRGTVPEIVGTSRVFQMLFVVCISRPFVLKFLYFARASVWVGFTVALKSGVPQEVYCGVHPHRESPHGRGCTFWPKGF